MFTLDLYFFTLILNPMRIISIIITDLAKDKLIAEEKLQRLINDKGDLETNIVHIKDQLREVVNLDRMIIKWKDYTNMDELSNNNDNEDK